MPAFLDRPSRTTKKAFCMATVFWSWQSDRSARETRDLIKSALQMALDRVAADLDERPELDHDTKGVPGSPDIASTILLKIDSAAVFVADVTPIAVSDAGKQVANPNVLIELGYAKKALGTERVVQVWNTAFTDARPEDLPFDMRGRRAPISYSLPLGADRSLLREVRDRVSAELAQRISASLRTLPAPPPSEPRWHPAADEEPSLWLSGGKPLVANTNIRGSARVAIASGPRGYARIIPSVWEPSEAAQEFLQGRQSHPFPLGDARSLSWGRTKGGVLAWRVDSHNQEVTESATRWFNETGEFWGVASSFFFKPQDLAVQLAERFVLRRWKAFLEHHTKLLRTLGGSGPIHLKLGLTGLDGVQWPHDRFHSAGDEVEAVESVVEYAAVLEDIAPELIAGHVHAAGDAVRGAFGYAPYSEAEFREAVSHRG